MEEGEFSVGQSGLATLMVGASFPQLFFKSKDKNRESIIQWNTGQRIGLYCRNCGTVLIKTRKNSASS